MKKITISILSVLSLLIFASCGGESKEAPKASASASSTDAKEEKADEPKEPQTACDCFEKYNKDLDKLLNASMKELAEKPLMFEDFAEKMANDERCEKLTSKFDNDEEAIKDECPEGKKFYQNIKKFESLGKQGDTEEEEYPIEY